MEDPNVTSTQEKKITILGVLLFLVPVMIAASLLGFTQFLPYIACLLILFGSNWSQLTEGLDILKKFELFTFLVVLIGILMFVGLLLEEFYFSGAKDATFFAEWKMLTSTDGGDMITRYEIFMCIINTIVWTCLSSVLKNNKEDIAFTYLLYFVIHLIAAKGTQTPVYPGSFMSLIWEPTVLDTIHHPSVVIKEAEPVLTKVGKVVWLIFKIWIGTTITISIVSYLKKKTKKIDWVEVFMPVMWVSFVFAGLIVAALLGKISDEWKIVRFLQALGGKWQIILGGIFTLLLFSINFGFTHKTAVSDFFGTESEATH